MITTGDHLGFSASGFARTPAGELDLDRTAESVARRFEEGATTVMLRPSAYLKTADGLDDVLAWMSALR